MLKMIEDIKVNELFGNYVGGIHSIEILIKDQNNQLIGRDKIDEISRSKGEIVEHFDKWECFIHKNFLIIIIDLSLNQSGILAIWDTKINNWFFNSLEDVCFKNITLNENKKEFHGTFYFDHSDALSQNIIGKGDFIINMEGKLKTLEYKINVFKSAKYHSYDKGENIIVNRGKFLKCEGIENHWDLY